MERITWSTSSVLMYIGMGMLLAMMFLGGADVIGRYFFHRPIVGTFEITEILLAGIVFFGLAYTQRIKGHATVSLVYSHLPPRWKTAVGFLNTLWLICLCILISWRGIMTAIIQWERHREVMNLGLPQFIFQLFVPVGALAMCLVVILEMFQYFHERRKDS